MLETVELNMFYCSLYQHFIYLFIEVVSISELTWENVGLASKLAEASASFSFSTLVDRLEGLDIILEENTSSTVLLTDGRVL